jgi:apolipoprotein N-acyltransferase
MRLIGKWSHLVSDVVMIILLIAGPGYAGFAGRQADLAWVLAGVMFLLVAFTLIKVVRFALHGAIEVVVVFLILIFPWIANFARGVHSRNFYLFVGVVMLVLWIMTDFRERRSAGHAATPKPPAKP